ncbi:unnamed protein product [Prorocentrum cordatum]|uniref:DNA (cytosine-5-)-methyltransferase n=1 Tax=Prorocentrum cordatum TaxID=2364126 RepID=A0ABN9XKD2_9DINO|nr:unnamed protein product [Polarella glacialis]
MQGLLAFFHKLGGLKVASVCSGTDSPLLVLNTIAEVCRKRLGDVFEEAVTNKVVGDMTCDDLETVVDDVFPNMKVLYSDVRELSKKSALPNLADPQQTEIPVPNFNILVGGFVCKDVSNMNCHREDNRTTVRDKSKKTGGTFGGIIDLLKKHIEDPSMMNPEVVFLENVKGLDAPPKKKEADGSTTSLPYYESNLSYCMDKMWDAGYFMTPLLLDPRCFAGPQSRQRYWLPAVRRALMEDTGLDQAELYSWIGQLTTRMACHGETPLDGYLLDSADADLREYLKNVMGQEVPWKKPDPVSSKKTDETSAKAKAAPKWVAAHAGAATKNAAMLTQTRISKDTLEDIAKNYPGVRSLAKRQFDMLVLAGMSPPCKQRRFLDLSQNLARTRQSAAAESKYIPCVTPRMEMWITDLARCVHGIESMGFQGIHFGKAHHVAKNYSSSFLLDLSGNAFHTGCMAACTMATFTAVGVALLRKKGMTFSAGISPSLAEPLENESDVELDDIW